MRCLFTGAVFVATLWTATGRAIAADAAQPVLVVHLQVNETWNRLSATAIADRFKRALT